MGVECLSIGEFSELTGISAHSLRFFDRIGLLSPVRSGNGYRSYSSAQVAQAQMILLLQRAKLPNSRIRELLAGQLRADGARQLAQCRQALSQEIAALEQAHAMIGHQLTMLAQSERGMQQLDRPFVERVAASEVGILALDTPQILDFFAEITRLAADPAWYLLHDYGFILERDEVKADGYPLRRMFTRVPRHVAQSPHPLPAGEVMGMYCRGSLENNAAVHHLLGEVRACGYRPAGTIRISNVSGPVIERHKRDFIIRIDIPLAGN